MLFATFIVATVFLTLSTLTASQITLPNPPYLPPNASFGTQVSNFTNVQTEALSHWSTLLGNLLFFYEAQRSGELPNTNRVSWRNDSALEDGQDKDLDLSGGYYDAGDYIKYTFPMSFSLMSICWGALDTGTGYGTANQTAYLDDMLRWGLDWLMKAHPSPDTLFVQVGDADLDNAYWGGDQGIPTPRTSFPINDTSPGTDAAAQASAAFSACSALYSNRTLTSASLPSLQNSSYASTLLTHAQQLYAFATNSSISQRTYQTSVPSVADAYASSGYGDELAIAALFLALANISSTDLSTSRELYANAEGFFDQYQLEAQVQAGADSVFNWDSKTPGIIVLGAQLLRAYPDLVGSTNASKWTSIADGYFDRIVNQTGRGYLTSGGLLYYAGDSDEASLNPALNAAMLLTRYASAGLAASDDRRTSYLTFAKSQVDYVLGSNPMTVPYVVGMHPNSPQNPHSAISTGAEPGDISQIDTVPAQERYVLYGGIVGGPDVQDRFWDLRSDWAQGEVALDYNAPLLTLAAYAVRNASDAGNQAEAPYYTNVQSGSYEDVRPTGYPCDAAVTEGCRKGGLSEGGKIAVGVVVSVVGCIVIGLGVWWIYAMRRNGKF